MRHEDLKKELLKNKDLTMDKAYEIGRMVKKLRIKMGLTQKDFAQKLNTKQSSIARIENGGAGLPSLSFLEKIAQVSGVELVLPRFKEFKMTRVRTRVLAR